MSLSKYITRIIPPNLNSGLYNIRILGMSGNAKASQQLEYLTPDQEVRVGSGRQSELYVVDDVIKKKS